MYRLFYQILSFIIVRDGQSPINIQNDLQHLTYLSVKSYNVQMVTKLQHAQNEGNVTSPNNDSSVYSQNTKIAYHHDCIWIFKQHFQRPNNFLSKKVVSHINLLSTCILFVFKRNVYLSSSGHRDMCLCHFHSGDVFLRPRSSCMTIY